MPTGGPTTNKIEPHVHVIGWRFWIVPVLALMLGFIAMAQNSGDVSKAQAKSIAATAANTAVENERVRLGYSINDKGDLVFTDKSQLKLNIQAQVPATWTADQLKCLVHTLLVNDLEKLGLDPMTCIKPTK